MDIPWQLCRTIGPLTLHSQEIYNELDSLGLFRWSSELLGRILKYQQ